MLKEQTLFGLEDKVADSIQLLRDLEPEEGYYLAFSGGKDSVCIKHVADMAEVKYDAHYSVTTIDPPELIYFIRDFYPSVMWDYPEEAFLHRLVKKGFPQRQRRWCCEYYKESGGSGRRVVTGIRRAESNKRAGRKAVEFCYRDKTKQYINPIISWTDNDVWEYINHNNLDYCTLYDEEWKRIGCLFCPMAGKHRVAEAKKYPGYTKQFIKAFNRLWEKTKSDGRTSVDRWSSGEEMFWWWLKEDRKYEDPDQTVMFE